MSKSLKTAKLTKKDFVYLIIMIGLFAAAMLLWWICPVPVGTESCVDSPYRATMDTNGNYYIINAGKSELLRIDRGDRSVTARLSSDSHEEDTFGQAESVAVDNAGNIFVSDVVWNDTGLGLAAERVLQFDPDGHFVKVVYEQTYSDGMVMKRHLFALSFRDGRIMFAGVDPEKELVIVYSYAAGQDNVSVDRRIENVENTELIQDICTGTDGIYYVTKNGEIFENDGEEITALYTIPEGEFLLPYSITCDEEGGVYFTDICNRDIYRISDEEVVLLYDMESMGELTGENLKDAILQTISHVSVDGRSYLCVAFNIGQFYIDISGDSADSFAAVPYCAPFKMMVIGMCVAFVLGMLLALYYLLVLCRDIIKSGILEKKRSVIILIFGVIISAVVVMSSLITRFKDSYVDQQISNMCTVTQIASSIVDTEDFTNVTYPSDYDTDSYVTLQKDMEKLIDVTSVYSENMYCNLVKMANGRCYALAYLDNSIGAFYPLDISEAKEVKEVYETKDIFINDGKEDATGSYVYVKSPIIDETGEVVGVVEIGMVSDTLTALVDEMRNQMMVTIALMVIIAVFVLNEVFAFMDDQKEWRQNKGALPLSYLRLITFFSFAAYNFPTSFLPVYVEKFYSDALPFSVELAGSLPLTVNFAMIGIMSLFCSGMLRKLGFRITMLAGSLVCFTGDMLMALSTDYVTVAAGLLLNGIGCGLVMNGLTIIVANQEDVVQQKGFSIINGAILSGMITGTVVGAAIAEKIGEDKMFLCSAGIWVSIMIVVLICGRSFLMKKGKEEKRKKVDDGKKAYTGKILVYLLLIVIPYTIVNGFTSYFLPVYADSNGLTQSQTSLFLVMNCLVGVFLSGALTNVMIKYTGRGAIYLSSILALGSVLLFGYFPNPTMLVFVLFLLGAAKSFGATSREIIFCKQPAMEIYGEDVAMGYYNLADNIGESLGTIVFGGITTIGFVSGAWILSGVSVAMLAVFELASGRKLKK